MRIIPYILDNKKGHVRFVPAINTLAAFLGGSVRYYRPMKKLFVGYLGKSRQVFPIQNTGFVLVGSNLGQRTLCVEQVAVSLSETD